MKKIKLKKCKVCEKEFTPFTTTDRFCTKKCALAYEKELRAKKRNKMTITKAEKRAWDAFSKYIRLRDCIKTTGTTTEGICVTCSKRIPYKGSQAGHAISGRQNSYLFNEDITNLQCFVCNYYKNGAYDDYSMVIIERVGVERFKEILSLKTQIRKISIQEFLEIEETYKNKYSDLLEKF